MMNDNNYKKDFKNKGFYKNNDQKGGRRFGDNNKRPYGGKSGYDRGPRRDERSEEERELILEGKNAIEEALESGRAIDKIMFAPGSHKTVGYLIARAREMGIQAQETDKHKLDRLSITGSHQGIVALCAAASYSTVEDILGLAEQCGEKPLLLICDGITDPHNLGAIIRTAEIVGAHGIIVPKRRSAGLNAACAKAAAGALEYMPIAKVSNLQACIEELKEKGIFIFAADMGGKAMYDLDFTVPAAIVIGSEGEGISRMVREKSDHIVSIPQKGRIQSLNASNAAAVLLYEALRQRGI